MIIKCPECGHQVSDRAKTCPSCGIDIAGQITRCPDCGEVIFKEQAECPNCHCTINAGATETEEILSVTTTALSVPKAEQSVDSEQKVDASGSTPVRRKRRRTGYAAVIIAFVIALIVVFLGLYFYQHAQAENEMRAFENALRSDQPAVLQNFLDMYGDAPRAHRDSIRSHLETLKKIDTDWEVALASGKKAEIEKYMRLHPNSIHNVEARLTIDSLDFETAKLLNTIEAYQLYMETHGQGSYYDEAANAYDQLREEERIRRIKAEQDSIAAAAQGNEDEFEEVPEQ